MAAPRGSLIALFVLVLTVLLGSSALHSLMTHFAPQLHSVIALLWLLTYLAGFMGLMFSHGINWISWLSRYRILLVILLLGTTISVSWSLDAAVSAERVIHLLGCSVLAIYLGFMIPLLTTLRVTAFVMAIIMLASLGSAMFMPALGMENYEGSIVWRGILNSKNALGFWAAVAVLLYITLSASYQSLFMKLMCYAMALVSLYVLIKSDSATSLLAMLVGGSLSLYLYIAFRFQLGFARMVVLAILLGGLLAFALSNIDTAQIVGRSGDLTGRGEVWRQTWKLIMKQPLTGYGYGSIWFPNDATLWIQQSLTDFTWVVYHAHNGFLQVASEIGLPLSCIALLMVAQQLIEIFYCQYERQQVGVLFVLSFVVVYLISNFSEARFLVNRELYWIFFLALPISMLRQINLVSLDEHEDSVEPHAPLDKPWLRPVRQTEAAKIGTAGAAYGGASHAVGRLRVDQDHAAASARTENDQLPRLKLSDDADIDLGAVGELDVAQSGDATLDTTLVISIHPDGDDQDVLDTSMVDDQSIIDSHLDHHPDDYKASIDHDEAVIRPYEEYNEDESAIKFDHSESDRYDKDLDVDDEDYHWVDISSDDNNK